MGTVRAAYLVGGEFDSGVGNYSDEVNSVPSEEAPNTELGVDLSGTSRHRVVLTGLPEAHSSLEDLERTGQKNKQVKTIQTKNKGVRRALAFGR